MNANLKRPKGIGEEDEDELFKFQEEFLRQKSLQPSAKVVKLTKNVQVGEEKPKLKLDFESDNHAFSAVLSDIVEKPILNQFSDSIPKSFNQLPKIEKLNLKELNQQGSGNKKSLFAQNLERQGKLKSFFDLNQVVQPSSLREDEKIKLVEKQITQEKTAQVQIISGEGLSSKKDAEQIHLENLELLSKMKPEEIVAEKNKLMQQLDPKIIAFIKRKSTQSPFGFRSEADKAQTPERPSDQDILEQLHIKPNKKWLHMDKIEYDKLEWMLKPKNVAKTEGSKSARFDFEGNLVSPEEEVSTIKALHHHGNEPDLAGYTLDELFHLARSKFNQQRVLALQTLGNILKKCHFGDYHEVIKSDSQDSQENDQNNLLNQLIEGGILFLLRWNLDDQTESIITASLEAIDNLLHHAEQEDVLDYAFDLYDGHEMPCLHPFSSIFADNKPKLSLDKNLNVAEEKDLEELKDDEFVRVDLIRGLFRMNLMERFFYLLNTYQPLNQVKIVDKIFSILFRCVRHSPEISFELIEKHSSLVDLMAKNFLPTFIDQNNCDVPSLLLNSTKTIKLLRLLSNTGPTIAFNLYKKFNLKVKIVNYLTLEKYLTEPNLAYLAIGLETETVRLLKTLIVYSHKEMGYECVIDSYEVLIEKLKNLMAQFGEENWKKVSLMQSTISLFGSVLKSATEPNLNFVSEISAAVYSLVASFVQKKFTSLFNNQIVQVTEKINFNLYSTCLNYLVDYLEKMELLTSFDKPADLSSRKRMYIEILIDSVVEPLVCKKYAINQLKLEQLVLSKLSTFSVYSQGPVREKFGKIFSNNLSYLPTICHISKIDQCDVIRQSPFGFLAAFIRLYNLCFLNRITVIDDSKFSNTKSLLTNSYINSYLKCFVKNNDQSLGSPLRSFYPTKFENWFVFNFLKTAFNLFNFVEEEENDQVEEIKSSREKYTDQEMSETRNQKRFFYLVSLSLLVKFRKGEESLIYEALSLFIFNLNFWSLYIDNKKTTSPRPADKSLNSLIHYFDKLELNNSLPQIKFSHININFAQSETILINRSFIENMESTHIYDLLNQIKFSYLQNQTLMECRLLDHSKNLKKINNSHLNTLFLSTDYSNQFLLRPDWIYAPILSEKADFSKISMLKDKEKDNQMQKTISNLSNSLKFIYLLESYFDKDYLEENLNSTLRYVKLLFVYLFDPEVFLEKQIITIMYLIFFKYAQDRKQPLSNLNFDQKFADVISFYDFYQHLLNQYDSSSFGDYLFAQYLVVPLQQCYPVKYRQLFWSDFHYLFKYMKFNDESSKMLIPLRKFVQPNEKYLNMIRLYSQLMLDPNDFKLVSESTLGYAILVASLNSFIFEHINKFENKVEFDFKKLLVKNFMKLNEKIRKDLIYYKDISGTMEHYEQLPDIRKQWLDQLMS